MQWLHDCTQPVKPTVTPNLWQSNMMNNNWYEVNSHALMLHLHLFASVYHLPVTCVKTDTVQKCCFRDFTVPYDSRNYSCVTVQFCVRHPAQFTSRDQSQDKLQTQQFLRCFYNWRNLGSKILGWRGWLLSHFNLSRPSGYFMYHQVILYPQSVVMCCVWRQITAL